MTIHSIKRSFAGTNANGKGIAVKMMFEKITSRNNPTVQLVASLKEKKFRDKHQAFLVEGEKMFQEAIRNDLPIIYLLISDSEFERLSPLVMAELSNKDATNIRILVLADHVFEKVSTEKSPQGIVTVIKHLDFFKKCTKINREELVEIGQAIFLCSMQDPGNLGAVIRSAVAFGADTVILSSDCADVYHPRTLRASMGTAFGVRIYAVEDVLGTVQNIQSAKRRVFAAELRSGAFSIDEFALRKEDILIIGNEGHGIPNEISAVCDASLYIPIGHGVESLNAAVAAAIFMREQKKYD